MQIFINYWIMLFFVFSANAQKSSVLKVNDNKKYVFVDTIKTYERIAEKGYRSVDMFKKIGDSYFSNDQLDKAVRWYCELFAMKHNIEIEYYFRYAESLKSVGENEEAKKIMEIFNKKSRDIKQKI